MLEAGDFIDDLGAENDFHDELEVVKAMTRRLDPAQCALCRERIFSSCPPEPRAEPAGGGPTTATNALPPP